MQAIRILAAAALVLVASTAAAQGGQGGGMRGQNAAAMNEMLFKGITLTDAQKAKVDSIQTKAREETMAMMQGGGMQDPGMREKMMEMRAKQNTDIRNVLTAEQQPIFDKNLAEMPAQGGRRRPPPLR